MEQFFVCGEIAFIVNVGQYQGCEQVNFSGKCG
jgi:hypothetical protein